MGLRQELMVSATLSFFPEFSSVYSTYLSSALSKGQSSFFITPMRATHRQKNLLHQLSMTKYPNKSNLRKKKGLFELMAANDIFSMVEKACRKNWGLVDHMASHQYVTNHRH